jgi:hypothetical protein
MTDSAATGLWILLAMVVIVIVVAGLAMSRASKAGHDGSTTDLEHFDHEPGDASSR